MKTLPRIMILAVLALTVAGWLARPDGKLHVFFLATPGDALLIQSPGGRFVLVDGGSDPALLALELGRRLPFWRRSLDAVVLTRPDGVRLPGQAAALTRYQARLAIAPPGGKGVLYARWRELLASHDARLIPARPGLRLPLGGATLGVLAPADAAAGAALAIKHGRVSLLLAGTLQPAQEHELLRGGIGAASVAYLPWQREIDAALLARLRPQAIIYADGYKAKKPALLTYHERAVGGAALYHEQNDGGIELISDGRQFRIQCEGPNK